jgi:hypothetical protein
MTATERHERMNAPLPGDGDVIVTLHNGVVLSRRFVRHEQEAVAAIRTRKAGDVADRELRAHRRQTNERAWS